MYLYFILAVTEVIQQLLRKTAFALGERKNCAIFNRLEYRGWN